MLSQDAVEVEYTVVNMGLFCHQRLFAVLGNLLLALAWLGSTMLWSRLEMPPSTIDLTPFISAAPRIFRGVVVDISAMQVQGLPSAAIARLKVQRWYRGYSGPETLVRYRTESAIPGHDCIDFEPGGYWLVFATERGGYLELVDDCYGAVTVSPSVAPVLQRRGVVSQIEADLVAGLTDSDPEARLMSLQRLGGLKSASSRPALHKVIEHGDATEQHWATYAALRTGDTTVLSRVREMFMRGDTDVPMGHLAWELGQLTDRSAIPELIKITDSAPDSEARKYALAALGENLRASEALPAIASRLTDPVPGVRLYALHAMQAITHEPACTLPMEPHWTDDLIEPQIRQCLKWWNQTGSPRSPPKQ